MMQQANFEFGFEAEDIPLMIEAIPMEQDCIVLLITKVEDPEELDTRFARFSPGQSDEDQEEEDFPFDSEDMMDLVQPITADQPEQIVTADAVAARQATRIFVFASLSKVMNAAAQIDKNCTCTNSLYKDQKNLQVSVLYAHKNALSEQNNLNNH